MPVCVRQPICLFAGMLCHGTYRLECCNLFQKQRLVDLADCLVEADGCMLWDVGAGLVVWVWDGDMAGR